MAHGRVHLKVEYHVPDQVLYVTVLYSQMENLEETLSYQLFLSESSVNSFLLMKVYKLYYKWKEKNCSCSAHFYITPGTNSC